VVVGVLWLYFAKAEAWRNKGARTANNLEWNMAVDEVCALQPVDVAWIETAVELLD
jgi:hypothetical protein